MSEQEADYRIELEAFSGPLDLLLYLIRREEVDIYDIPIARITEQYLRAMAVIAELNIELAGEFLVMAATLIEIKSRMMAPEPEQADEEDPEDPRLELVRQLMEYKRFKEAALALTDRAQKRAERFSRPGERVEADEPAPRPGATGDLTVWSLLDSFSRILEQTGRRGPHRIILDNIPQEELQVELEENVRAAGRMTFGDLFSGQADRSILVGMFLALLELVRQQAIRVEQGESFGEIVLIYVPPAERQAVEPPAAASGEPESDAPDQREEEDGAEWSEEEVSDIEMPDVPEVADAPPVEADAPLKEEPSSESARGGD